MGENGDKKTEMSPQEDGSKLPLTDGNPSSIDESKTANGDAKIEIAKDDGPHGLTKEELMKYIDDPFWVRIRWILFVAFWLVWVLMLVFAIVIIVRAPKCAAPPELLWVQESPLIKIATNELPTGEDLVKLLDAQGASSVYFPNLISDDDFDDATYDVTALIAALGVANYHAVVNMPSRLTSVNPLYDNFTAENLIYKDGDVNYENRELAQRMYENVAVSWMAKGVKGFMIDDPSSIDVDVYVNELNTLLAPEGGAMANDIKDSRSFISDPFVPSQFREFLESETGNWSFYEFNPSYVAGSSLSTNDVRLLDIALYLFPGTPILKWGPIDNATTLLLDGLAEFRMQDGLKFGVTEFSNTSADVVAYTRVYKGTPAYAVALNFGNNTETVDFASMNNVADSGTVEMRSSATDTVFDTRSKIALDAVPLLPYEGKVLQFVAKFG